MPIGLASAIVDELLSFQPPVCNRWYVTPHLPNVRGKRRDRLTYRRLQTPALSPPSQSAGMGERAGVSLYHRSMRNPEAPTHMIRSGVPKAHAVVRNTPGLHPGVPYLIPCALSCARIRAPKRCSTPGKIPGASYLAHDAIRLMVKYYRLKAGSISPVWYNEQSARMGEADNSWMNSATVFPSPPSQSAGMGERVGGEGEGTAELTENPRFKKISHGVG